QNKAAMLPLRAGGLAGGIVGPVAVEADHAPVDAPPGAAGAGVVADRVVDPPPRAVAHHRVPGAEAARNRGVVPRPPGSLADALDAVCLQAGTPAPRYPLA